MADGEGKGSVAESDWLPALIEAGNAILAVDTRGRGETLGHMGRRTNNYHLVSISLMAGRPLAGRRAFDLTRAVDFVAHRPDLPLEELTIMGRNGDTPPGAFGRRHRFARQARHRRGLRKQFCFADDPAVSSRPASKSSAAGTRR